VGAKDIIIRGIITLNKDKAAFRGFPLVDASEADRDVPVILSVSRYYAEEYKAALRANGITDITEMKF
jgi:hypothetical protein